MKHGAMLANAAHFDVEIAGGELAELAIARAMCWRSPSTSSSGAGGARTALLVDTDLLIELERGVDAGRVEDLLGDDDRAISA